MTFYNQYGEPIAYTENNEDIYLFNGQPVAYIFENTIYGFNGHQFGWFENGWIRDLNGFCVFFTEFASGFAPVKPVKHVKPVKQVKHVKPMKHVKHIRQVKPVSKSSWSILSENSFFEQ